MSKRALLSVSDKTGLETLGKDLVELGYELIASGGTASRLESAGVPVTPVERVTGAPELLGGRVKTLHPHIHGAILARGTDQHLAELAAHDIGAIDLVVCNLYPFQETLARGVADDLAAVEQIDIGGVTLMRAAAKNFERVAILCSPRDYTSFIEALRAGTVDTAARKQLALAAFRHTAAYDVAIATWLQGDLEEQPSTHVLLSAGPRSSLRYGENPHQRAAWYPLEGEAQPFEVLQGKALSYNNLVDLDAAWQMPAEINAPCVAIVKHTNPCGMAQGPDVVSAYEKALACDPVSAFGSIIAVNRAVDLDLVEAIGKLFVEVIIAPDITPPALERLATTKKNCRVVRASTQRSSRTLRSVAGGLLVQETDATSTPVSTWNCVTSREPTPSEWSDLEFAWRAVKHVKSNAIVLVKEEATLGVGAGQTSRVGAVSIACDQAGLKAQGAVLASDAFFPFADGLEAAAAAGVTAIIQPGGSRRDAEVIDAAERLGVSMVFTGARHFRH